MATANLSIAPRHPGPWIVMDGEQRGLPTPAFYRFIISLLNLAGGSADFTLEQLAVLFAGQPIPSESELQQIKQALDNFRAQSLARPNPVLTTSDLDNFRALSLAKPNPPDTSSALASVFALQNAQPSLAAQVQQLSARVDNLTALLLARPNDPVFPYTNKTPFTPTITFATPGDLSVAYTTQNAAYARFGPLILFWITVAFTPTYTTASGNFLVGTLPVVPLDAVGSWGWPIRIFASPTWPASRTQIGATNNTAGTILIQGLGSGQGSASFSTTQIVSGTAYTLTLDGFYF